MCEQTNDITGSYPRGDRAPRRDEQFEPIPDSVAAPRAAPEPSAASTTDLSSLLLFRKISLCNSVFIGVGSAQDISVQGHSLLRLTAPRNPRQTARQLDSESVKKRNFLLRTVEKRIGQSCLFLGSILVQPRRSFDQKYSLRFAPERPVDAHFRSALKTTPTPNESEPRLLFHIEASSAQAELPPKIPSRLTQRFVSYDPSNFASNCLLLRSATDRRQLHPRMSKFRESFPNIDRIQQKGRQRHRGQQDLNSCIFTYIKLQGRTQLPRPVPG